MSLYLAAYDVGDNRRRRAVARTLGKVGSRVQASVFEVRLEPAELRALRVRIGALLSPDDEFLVVPVDERGDRVRFRWRRPPNSDPAVYFA